MNILILSIYFIMQNKSLKKLHNKKRAKLIRILTDHKFKINDHKNYIEFYKGIRSFNLHSLDNKDPSWLTTDINLDKYLKSNFFLKSKHSKSFQDKIHNEKMNLDGAFEVLNWTYITSYGIKDFDINPTIEEPFTEVIHQITIRDVPHIIIDDYVYEGEALSIVALTKPLAEEALIDLSSPALLQEILAI